jgi:hypothetical protein
MAATTSAGPAAVVAEGLTERDGGGDIVASAPPLSASDSETRPPPLAKSNEPAAAAAGVDPEAQMLSPSDEGTTHAIGLPEFVSAALQGAALGPGAVAEVCAALARVQCSTTAMLLSIGTDANRLVRTAQQLVGLVH